MPDQLAIDFARQQGHTAAQASAERADRTVNDWTDQALAAVKLFAQCHRHEPFLAEDIRAFADGMHLPPPPDGRAWGHVMQRAKHQGLITPAGFAAAKSSNGSPKVRWRTLADFQK